MNSIIDEGDNIAYYGILTKIIQLMHPKYEVWSCSNVTWCTQLEASNKMNVDLLLLILNHTREEMNLVSLPLNQNKCFIRRN